MDTVNPAAASARSSIDSSPIVAVNDLRKSYGGLEAVRGIGFEIRRGEVFGLLGPNGAGKTTTIEMLEGLRRPDAGSVRVCGLDPAQETAALKGHIGAQLQATVLPDKIRTEEALRLFAGLYQRSLPIESLLERFGLVEKRHTFFENLSGGQKQRLALALALVNDPELVLLDEPTAGLDAMVRRDIYALIEQLRSENRTVLLTTHYIEEAERLADRVAIMDQGRLIAIGTPQELVGRSGEDTRMTVRLQTPVAAERLRALEDVIECAEHDGGYVLRARSVAKSIVALVRFLESQGNTLLDLHIARPTLEDVFVEMTGRKMNE